MLRLALLGEAWCPRSELNRNHTFRKRVLYPFELRGLVKVNELGNYGREKGSKFYQKFYLVAPY